MPLTLRPYQQTIIHRIREHLRAGKRSVLCVSPTGSGKTALTAHMIAGAVAKGKRAWFTVHRSELVTQSVNALENSAGLDVGVIAAGFGANGVPAAQVCSIQTLMRRWQKYPLPDLLVIDECTHQCSRSWSDLVRKIIDAKPSVRMIGLTATPTRLDGRGLGEWYQVMVEGPSTQQLIADGWLSPYKLFAPSMADLKDVHTVAGDYNRAELDVAMRGSKVTGDAIAEYKSRCAGKRALMFLWSVESSKEMTVAFNSQGIRAAHIDGCTDDNERARMVRMFRSGEIKVLTNVEIVTEGFDCPGIEACFLLRPTQSLGLYLQMVGRALRPFEGKQHALLLDHAGLAFRHGLPDDPRVWTLEGTRGSDKKKQESPIRQCLKCYFVVPAPCRKCPECGFLFEIQYRKIEQEAGELREINPEDMRRMFNVTRKAEQAHAQSLDELRRIERDRGYKRGWAQHIFEARQNKLSKQAREER